MGDKVGREKESSRIFSDEDAQLYGKIYEYEREFKDYVENFLRDREILNDELDEVHKHLKNVKGADESREKLEKYLKRIDFDFASIVFIEGSPEEYKKKIEIIEEFVEKLVN